MSASALASYGVRPIGRFLCCTADRPSFMLYGGYAGFCCWSVFQLLKLACARALRVRTRLLQLFFQFCWPVGANGPEPVEARASGGFGRACPPDVVNLYSIFVSMFWPPLLKGGRGVGSAQGLLDLLVLTDTGYGVGRGVGGCITPVFARKQLYFRCAVCGRFWANCECKRGD